MSLSIHEKFMRVALAAALVFMLFPVSTGLDSVDKMTHDDAEAIAPAIPIVAVFGTIIIAYGIYVGGTTIDDYNANLNTLFEDFGDFYVGDIEAVLGASWTDDGFINLAAIPADFWSALQDWSSGLVSSGQAESSNSSLVPSVSSITLDKTYRATTDDPFVYRYDNEKINEFKTNPNWAFWKYAYEDGVTTYWVYSTSGKNLTDVTVQSNGRTSCSLTALIVRISNGQVTSASKWNNGLTDLPTVAELDTSMLNLGVNWSYSGTAVEPVVNQPLAGVSESVIDGTAAVPTTTVEPFEPTAEQLESGYTLEDVVEAVEGGAETTGEINETVSGISADVGTIENILSGLRTTPFGWIADFIALLTSNWSSLLSWLGATPISTLLAPLSGITSIVTSLTGQNGVLEWMGTTTISELFAGVSSGITGITDAISGIDTWLGDISLPRLWEDVTGIATGVDGVLAGVNDVSSWWGTLSGWWEGLNQWLGVDGLTLEGVLEGVLSGALAGTLADVIEAIQAGILDITGAIEGITFPEFPTPSDETGGNVRDVAEVGADDIRDLNGTLATKAPFAYVMALGASYARLVDSYSSNASFYFELDIPEAGVTRFDAGEWLNYDVNGVTIAYLIRMMVTASIVGMIIGLAYRVFVASNSI